MAFYHLKVNEPELALRQLERALVLDEKLPLIHFFKGWALEQLGEEKEAKIAYMISRRLGEWEKI